MTEKKYFPTSMDSLNQYLNDGMPVGNIVMQYDATFKVAQLENPEGAMALLIDAGKKVLALIVDEMDRCLDEPNGLRYAAWYNDWITKIIKYIGVENIPNLSGRQETLLSTKVLPDMEESIKDSDEKAVIGSYIGYGVAVSLSYLGVSPELKSRLIAAEEILKDQMIDLANYHLDKEQIDGRFPRNGKGVWFAQQVTRISLLQLCDNRGNMGLKELTLNKRFGTVLPLPER